MSRASITATPDLADDTRDLHFVPAPCQQACPVGTDAPSYIGLVWEERFEDAFEAIAATNPLSSICGRVCDAPCEPACRRADSDGPIAIRELKRYVLDRLGPGHALAPVAVSRPETVAIVGGGPAGLTAAQDLAEAGFAVHLYEASDRLGGMAVWGIPRFRLPDGIIAQDVDRILAHCPGISVHLNRALGRDVTLAELKAKHDVVLLAIGASRGRTMGIPGETAQTVVDGVGFLKKINQGERPTLPGRVLVIGGGDVAMDACRVAKRLPGVTEVQVLYRRGPDEMPARRHELDGALKEGITIVYNTAPEAVRKTDDGVILSCVKTELGEADASGRRRPLTVPGSQHDIACGLVIAAVGQEAECQDLDILGMMAGDRIKTSFETMRTDDPQVFAAGDGAFGGSSIVMAMHHGHKAAYYIKAHLDAIKAPLAYRTPYRTRRVAVCNDPDWETNPRQHGEFLGLGTNPTAFAEFEATFSPEQAKQEAARCFRCDAETASSDYTVRTREAIFRMARTPLHDIAAQAEILSQRLAPRPDPFPEGRPATLEDLVFLPANLTRLVIDPYREACRTESLLGGAVKLAAPFVVAGLDEAPEQVARAAAKSIADQGVAYLGRKPLEGAAWLQIVTDRPSPKAAAHLYAAKDALAGISLAQTDLPVGLITDHAHLEAAIAFGLDHGHKLLVLDTTDHGGGLQAELAGPPNLEILRDAIRVLRARNAEEVMDIIILGGVRTGTDAAKFMAMGANACAVQAAAVFSLGGGLENGSPVYRADLGEAERSAALSQLLVAFVAEASMMARCTGKTNVHNLEPEDLRAVNIVASKATGMPIAGRKANFAAA